MGFILDDGTMNPADRGKVGHATIEAMQKAMPVSANAADVLRILATLAASFISSNFPDPDDRQLVIKEFLIITAAMEMGMREIEGTTGAVQ